MSEPLKLSKVLGLERINIDLYKFPVFRAEVVGGNRVIDIIDQRSPDVEELAFLIYFHGIPSSDIETARRLWKQEMVDCAKYMKLAQEIINKMSVWIVKKG